MLINLILFSTKIKLKNLCSVLWSQCLLFFKIQWLLFALTSEREINESYLRIQKEIKHIVQNFNRLEDKSTGFFFIITIKTEAISLLPASFLWICLHTAYFFNGSWEVKMSQYSAGFNITQKYDWTYIWIK